MESTRLIGRNIFHLLENIRLLVVINTNHTTSVSQQWKIRIECIYSSLTNNGRPSVNAHSQTDIFSSFILQSFFNEHRSFSLEKFSSLQCSNSNNNFLQKKTTPISLSSPGRRSFLFDDKNEGVIDKYTRLIFIDV